MPGICDAKTVSRHHMKNVMDHRSIQGNITGNPWFNDIRRIAELMPVDFCVYSLFDGFGRVSEVLAGTPADVHEAGIRKVKEDLGFRVSRMSDITIVSSSPTMKALKS